MGGQLHINHRKTVVGSGGNLIFLSQPKIKQNSLQTVYSLYINSYHINPIKHFVGTAFYKKKKKKKKKREGGGGLI